MSDYPSRWISTEAQPCARCRTMRSAHVYYEGVGHVCTGCESEAIPAMAVAWFLWWAAFAAGVPLSARMDGAWLL